LKSSLRLAAVSYLNTLPLVAGLSEDVSHLNFYLPAECAERIREGAADVGLLPVIEADRMHLGIIGDCCIGCDGPVRSILLFARKPWSQVQTLAADSGSRTSVQLARILLAERYGAVPQVFSMRADLASMLGQADAALLIGDPALRIEPQSTGLPWLDLGEEWRNLSGLPMVFAVWAARVAQPELVPLLAAARQRGLETLSSWVDAAAQARGLPPALAEHYLRTNIIYQRGPREEQGLDEYLRLSRAFENRMKEKVVFPA
jgi:chorismate dehydratase